MKKLLVIFFFFVACTGNYHPKDVGTLSILEYPDNKELNKWIEIDSQYAKVYQVRRYFENFVKKDFFEFYFYSSYSNKDLNLSSNLVSFFVLFFIFLFS